LGNPASVFYLDAPVDLLQVVGLEGEGFHA